MVQGKKGRDRAKERWWRRTLKRHEVSGLSVRLFCRQEELAESAFYFWRRELRKRDAEHGDTRSARSSTPAFAAVSVARMEEDAQQQIEIVVRDSLRVRIPCGFDAGTLRDVLAVLEERPC